LPGAVPGKDFFCKRIEPANSSCPGLSRVSTSLLNPGKKDVDGRDEPGHDEKRVIP
jgi:hypothetical protein